MVLTQERPIIAQERPMSAARATARQMAARISQNWDQLPDLPSCPRRVVVEELFDQITQLTYRGYSLTQIHQLLVRDGLNIRLDTFQRYYYTIRAERQNFGILPIPSIPAMGMSGAIAQPATQPIVQPIVQPVTQSVAQPAPSDAPVQEAIAQPPYPVAPEASIGPSQTPPEKVESSRTTPSKHARRKVKSTSMVEPVVEFSVQPEVEEAIAEMSAEPAANVTAEIEPTEAIANTSAEVTQAVNQVDAISATGSISSESQVDVPLAVALPAVDDNDEREEDSRLNTKNPYGQILVPSNISLLDDSKDRKEFNLD
jgi:hypothetical protein